ncbi:cytochrome c oxidase accessory protein CcoG [Aquabacterium sp.]|uniref:cytochrome c oxidase accessory protein CcoG n=1 Tax=Aquabacterium sp. TaxID=1872578 RepID=UPI0025C63D3D|nr:cytochrome c oxidase accessory protein CcoG [Aquabacterium sp.]
MSESRRIIPILPPALRGIEAAHKVQARTTHGRFTRLRWATLWATQLFFLGVPWLQWHGRQMVRFDLEAKRFYLGHLILLPQDLIFLAGLLVFCALLLFVVTTLLGRVWCGFSCPQTVYTAWFMALERLFEGDRRHRLQLDQSPWGWGKLWRRGGKQLSWVLVSAWTGFTFVGWFSPVREMGLDLLQGSVGFWDGFWALFYGAFCYLNAGVLREKVCLHMCPYGRFQGALMDADTLTVAYDARRGEPRGAQRQTQGVVQASAGSCIDCTVCVQVCPTGIDIRDGLQAACIGCGLCIDACDTVMDKIGQPRGLVRMATERQLACGDAPAPGHGGAPASPWARQRVRVYGGLMALLLGGLAWGLAVRPDVRVDVIRDRGVMARAVEDGAIENVYRLQLMNQTDVPQRIEVAVAGLPGAVAQASAVTLGPVEDRQVHVSVRLTGAQAARLAGQTLPLQVQVASRSAERSSLVSEASTFIVPR